MDGADGGAVEQRVPGIGSQLRQRHRRGRARAQRPQRRLERRAVEGPRGREARHGARDCLRGKGRRGSVMMIPGVVTRGKRRRVSRKHLGGAAQQRQRRQCHRRDVQIWSVHVPRGRGVPRGSARARDALGLPDAGVGPAAEPGGREQQELGAAVGRGDGERRGAANGGEEGEEPPSSAGVGIVPSCRAVKSTSRAPFPGVLLLLLRAAAAASDQRPEARGRPGRALFKEPAAASAASAAAAYISAAVAVEGGRREARHQVGGVHSVDASGPEGRSERGLGDGGGLGKKVEKKKKTTSRLSFFFFFRGAPSSIVGFSMLFSFFSLSRSLSLSHLLIVPSVLLLLRSAPYSSLLRSRNRSRRRRRAVSRLRRRGGSRRRNKR